MQICTSEPFGSSRTCGCTTGVLLCILMMSVSTWRERTHESTWDRSSSFPSVYSSHKTLLWYISPSDLLNCDLPGSMPCPLNEHVHWNTGWGRASTMWTNTSAEEFWLSPPRFQNEAYTVTKSRSAKASGIALNLRWLSSGHRRLLREDFWVYPSAGFVPR